MDRLKRFLLVFAITLFVCGLPLSETATSTDGVQTSSRPVADPNAIKMGTCVISPPYEFVDEQGQYAGLTADYVNLLQQKTGEKFKRVRCTDVERMFKAVELEDVDFIPLVERTPELLETMDFIFPYIQQPTVIVTNSNAHFGTTLDSLQGKRVVLPPRSGAREYVRKLYGSKIDLLIVGGSPVNALETILIGGADAALLDLSVATYLLERKRFQNMRLAGFTDYVAVRGIAVRKGMPEVKAKLEQALNAVPSEEHSEMLAKWLTQPSVPFWEDHRLIAWTLIIVGLGLASVALVLGWNATLQSKVRKRTATLQAINNMLLGSISSRTEQQTQEACLGQLEQTMNASIAFLAHRMDGKLKVKASTSDLPEYLPECIELSEHFEGAKPSAHFLSDDPQGECIDLGRHMALRSFTGDGSEALVVGVAKDEEFSDESLKVFDNLVPAFEQVLGRKQVELSLVEKDKQILRAQRMESLGTMTGGIAHDFNNILGVIIANGEMIELFHSVKDDGVKSKIESILTAAYRGRDVVRQVLGFARPNNESVKALQLDALVVETERMLRASLPQSINIDLDLEDDVVVVANPTQISQVIMNLCMNSAQAMEESGGTLGVTLKVGDSIPEALLARTELVRDKAAMLEVRDDGPGMTPEVLDRIFDPFFSTKPPGKGTGLGLAVVSGIVFSYGGTIDVDSEPGKGTVTRVLLPCCDDTPLEQADEISSRPDTGAGKILFVDDDEEIRQSYTEILRKIGYVVHSMPSADEALAHLRENPNGYSLVLTDYNMPGMTGDVFAKEVMQLSPDVPVILCTGFSSRFDERKAEGLGLAALLKKPVSIRELTEAVGQFILPDEDKA